MHRVLDNMQQILPDRLNKYIADSGQCGYGRLHLPHVGYVQELVAVALGELAVGGIHAIVCHDLSELLALVVGALLLVYDQQAQVLELHRLCPVFPAISDD